ncbi:MAG TPA: hypothetical protein VGC80_09020 [Acetobacteraceae bacterium]
MADWRTTRAAIAADRGRLRAHLDAACPPDRRSPLRHLGFWAILLYRLSHYLHRKGLRLPARLIWLCNICLTGADIDCATSVGAGTVITHPRAVIIYGQVGENCTFMAQTGIGGLFKAVMADIGAGKGRPVLADEVMLAPGALVLGPVRVGRRVRIGPRIIVTKDVPDDAQVVHRRGWPMAA